MPADRRPLAEPELDYVAKLLLPGPTERSVVAHQVMDVDEGALRDALVTPGGLGLLEVDEVGVARRLAHTR